eukprot:4442807-Amphidinium_carterae.1
MVLVARGMDFIRHLCYGYRHVHRSLTEANMKVRRAGRLRPVKVTKRDLAKASGYIPANHDETSCAFVHSGYHMDFKDQATTLRSLSTIRIWQKCLEAGAAQPFSGLLKTEFGAPLLREAEGVANLST